MRLFSNIGAPTDLPNIQWPIRRVIKKVLANYSGSKMGLRAVFVTSLFGSPNKLPLKTKEVENYCLYLLILFSKRASAL